MKKDASPQRTQFIMMFFAFAFGMILSSLLNTQSQTKAESEQKEERQEILFIYRGIEKTQHHLIEADRLKINDLDNKKIKLIESAALRQYFSDQAQHYKVDAEDVAKKVLDWKPVSKSDVNHFYELNKDSINKPFFEVQKDIKKNLELKLAGVARRKLLDELIQKGELAILPNF